MTAFDRSWGNVPATFQDPGSPSTAPHQPDPQTLAQRLLEVKAEATAFADRQQSLFNAEMRRHLEAVQQRCASAVPTVLTAAVDTAHQALLEARRTAAEARQVLSQHEAARPRVATDVPAWAKRKGELADELSAYDAIAADADAAYAARRGDVDRAMQLAWARGLAADQKALDEYAATFHREMEAARAELNKKHEQGQQRIRELNAAVAWWSRFT